MRLWLRKAKRLPLFGEMFLSWQAARHPRSTVKLTHFQRNSVNSWRPNSRRDGTKARVKVEGATKEGAPLREKGSWSLSEADCLGQSSVSPAKSPESLSPGINRGFIKEHGWTWQSKVGGWWWNREFKHCFWHIQTHKNLNWPLMQVCYLSQRYCQISSHIWTSFWRIARKTNTCSSFKKNRTK